VHPPRKAAGGKLRRTAGGLHFFGRTRPGRLISWGWFCGQERPWFSQGKAKEIPVGHRKLTRPRTAPRPGSSAKPCLVVSFTRHWLGGRSPHLLHALRSSEATLATAELGSRTTAELGSRTAAAERRSAKPPAPGRTRTPHDIGARKRKQAALQSHYCGARGKPHCCCGARKRKPH
jgi:hypothetical protein